MTQYVGYAGQPPQIEWPEGARLALNIVLNFEEGAEASLLRGDPQRDARAEAQYDVPLNERELIQESTYQYGSRVGHWRLLDILEEFGATATVFAAGLAVETNAALTQRFVQHGCDFVGHGYRWIGHFGMTEEEERDDIRRGVDAIQAATGQPVLGWWNRPPVTPRTREFVAEAGLLFDSTAVNDDSPYYVDVLGRPLLILPYSLDANDTRFWKQGFVTATEFSGYLIDAFDMLYRESAKHPRMMSVGLHGRILGRPGRALALARFLEHVRRHDDVWVANRSDIARTFAEQFAPADAWNWEPRHAAGPA
jgi:allantoinase